MRARMGPMVRVDIREKLLWLRKRKASQDPLSFLFLCKVRIGLIACTEMSRKSGIWWLQFRTMVAILCPNRIPLFLLWLQQRQMTVWWQQLLLLVVATISHGNVSGSCRSRQVPYILREKQQRKSMTGFTRLHSMRQPTCLPLLWLEEFYLSVYKAFAIDWMHSRG